MMAGSPEKKLQLHVPGPAYATIVTSIVGVVLAYFMRCRTR